MNNELNGKSDILKYSLQHSQKKLVKRNYFYIKEVKKFF